LTAHNIFRRMFTAVCRKISTSCASLLFNRRRCCVA